MKRLALIFSLIIILLAGFWVGLGVFIRSDAFRLWLGHRVGQSLGAEGSFEPLSWTGATFRSGGFKAAGQSGSKFSAVRLTGLTAHLDWPKLLAGQIVQIGHHEKVGDRRPLANHEGIALHARITASPTTSTFCSRRRRT